MTAANTNRTLTHAQIEGRLICAGMPRHAARRVACVLHGRRVSRTSPTVLQLVQAGYSQQYAQTVIQLWGELLAEQTASTAHEAPGDTSE